MRRLPFVGCVLIGLAPAALAGCLGPTKKSQDTVRPRPARVTPRDRARVPPMRSRRAARPAPGMVTIKGWRLEVLLVPERVTFMAGEPIYLSFKVHNHSRSYLQIYDGGDTRNRLSRPNAYRVRVRPVGGSPLPLRDVGPTLGGLAYARRMLPDDGFTRELFLPNWAHITRPGRYEILCTRKLHVDKHDAKKQRPKKGEKGVQVTARALVTVTATTTARMGKLIKELAEIMLSSNWASIRKAAQALAAIRDPRIVPHFIKAMKRNRYNTSQIAARIFGRFATDAALAGLKLCKVHRSRSVRKICARSLANSSHPKAWPLLVSLKDDGDRIVRLAVVRALGSKGCAPKILRLIRKLSADDVASVKKEAKVHLDRCRKKRRPRSGPRP